MENIKKIFLLLSKINFNYKLYILTFICLSFIVSLFEIMGLGLILPLLDTLINEEQNRFIEFIRDNKFFNFENSDDLFILKILTLLIFGIYLIKFFVYVCWIYFINNFSTKTQNDIASSLIKEYLHQDYSNFIKRNKGDFIRNLNTEVNYAVSMMIMSLNLLNEIILIIFISIFFFLIKPVVTVYFFVILLLLFFFHALITKNKLTKLGTLRSYFQSEIITKLNQIFSAIKEIKLSKIEDKYINDFNYNFSKFNQKLLRISFLNSLPKPVLEIVFVSFFCSLLFFYLFNQEKEIFLSFLPELAVMILCLIRILPSISRALILKQNITTSSKALDIVLQDLKDNLFFFKEIRRREESITFNNLIELKQISFKYDNSNTYILKKFDLKIKKNSCLGIYGKSGVGKTTLVDIICGLIKPQDGQICIDNKELNNFNKSSWQKKISYVSQNFYMLNDTIKNNIILFNNKPLDQTKFDEAINISQINFKKNILHNEKIGETGNFLSGGQNQRIAIARAIYQDNEILIFDEPSNMLDKETKTVFLTHLAKLKKNKTIIIVSHDEETLDICDEKIEL